MPLYRFAFLFVLPMVLCLSLAKDVHFGPEHWTANNHARVFDGYADEGWLTRDAGGKSPHDQQWVWMDFTAALSGIETDDRIIQASLTWPGVRENWADAAPGLVYRLFPVQDGNFGRDQIYAAGATTTREAGDVVAYNQANVGYGEVRDLDMAFQAKAMDITELIRGWHNGSIPGNREAVLLWDKQAVEGQILQAFWGNQLSATAGTGPSIEITTMKPEPFTPEVIGPLPVSYNPQGVRQLSMPPSPGIHPRLYFNAEDIPEIRHRLLHTAVGQETMKTIRIYTDILRRGRHPAWNLLPATDRVQANGESRVSNPGLWDRHAIYNEMIAGDLDALSAQHESAFQIVSGMMALEAFECWIDDGQPGVDPAAIALRRENLAKALATHAQWVIERTDYPGNLDVLGSSRISRRLLFGGPHSSITYDLVYNWMTEEQRTVVRKAIGLFVKGALQASQNGTGEAYYGISTAAESTTSNWATLDLYEFIIAASIEGEITEDLDLGFTSKDLADWFHAAAGAIHRFYTYGFFPNGAPLEGLGKNYVFSGNLVAISKRGYPFFEHPHVRNYATQWMPNLTQPFGYGFTAFDEIGGDGYDPEKGGKRLSGQDPLGFKYMYPQDPGVDFVWRNHVKVEHTEADGTVREIIPVSDSRYSPRSAVNNSLFELAVFGAHDPAYDVDFASHAALALPELDAVDHYGGTFIARSGHDAEAARLLMHTRQNSGGHTMADRNTFTFSALGRLFINYNSAYRGHRLMDGQFHALIDVDGVNMARPLSGGAPYLSPAKLAAWSFGEGEAAFATGDATSAYMNQWALYGWGNQVGFTPVTVTYNDFQRAGEGDRLPYWNTPLHEYPHWLLGNQAFEFSYDTHNPMRQVYRTTGLVKGDFPYALVFDDIQKDDAPHTYRWYASIPTDLSIRTGNELPAGLNPATDVLLAEPAATGTRRLLVRILRANGTPAMSTSPATDDHTFQNVEGSPLAYTEDIVHNTAGALWKRLVIERQQTVAPGYRLLLYPFRQSDPLPVTAIDDGGISIAIGRQSDRLDFHPRTPVIDNQAVVLNEFILSRSGDVLLDYRNQIEPMPVRRPSTAVPPRKAAPALQATPNPDGTVRLAWSGVALGDNRVVVERRLLGQTHWQPLHASLPAAPSVAQDNGVFPGARYDYRIRSVGPTGLSEYAFASATSSATDSDGDGWPDLAEIYFASNPADPNSRPPLIIPATSEEGVVTLEVPVYPGRSFSVQTCTDLVTGDWLECLPDRNVTPLHPSRERLSISKDPAEVRRLYRAVYRENHPL